MSFKSFRAFMQERQDAILRGEMGHVKAGVDTLQRKEPIKSHYVALSQQRAEKSDPHVYNRVMSHLQDGTDMNDDYEVRFGHVKCPTAMSLAFAKAFDRNANVEVEVAMKRKVA